MLLKGTTVRLIGRDGGEAYVLSGLSYPTSADLRSAAQRKV